MRPLKYLNNDKGFVLIVSLILLVVLMIIGIAATNTTTIELQIAGNDKAQKQTFYNSDGGSEVAMALLEENITESGFDSAGDYFGVDVSSPAFYMNETMSGADASVTFPSGTTELRFFNSPPEFADGSGAQTAAGYEGLGKGGGSAYQDFTIQSLSEGPINTETAIRVRWRHLIR